VLLATCDAFPDVAPWDGDLVHQLGTRGIRAVCRPWTQADPAEPWDAVLLRLTWDYPQRWPEFQRWLDALEAAGQTVWNTPDVVRWNAHKSYLRDLEGRGIPIPPTVWCPRGEARSLSGILASQGWANAVAKPAVSADAHHTRRVSANGADDAWFQSLCAQRDMLVQPFLPAIQQEGEWAFVFLGGAFCHAVLKRPASGDWRVQPRFQGTARAVEPPPDRLRFAERVMAQAPKSLYARVDVIWQDGEPMLMELELIEPYLFLDKVPGSAGRFADAIAKRLQAWQD